MAIYRAHVALGADGPLARDRFVITPHFRSVVGGENFTTIAQDIAEDLQGPLGVNREIKVTIYSAEGPKPHYPLGTYTAGANLYPASTVPRELALCLSYYSGINVPRFRGRLYIPLACTGVTTTGLRPSQTAINPVKEVGLKLAGAGPTSWEWVVFSRRDNAARPVTNYYVDDEWDVVRSRGGRPTFRDVATTTG
jgi:hypothetical protein